MRSYKGDKEYSRAGAVKRAKTLSQRNQGEFIAFWDDDYECYLTGKRDHMHTGPSGVMDHEIVGIWENGERVG